MVFSTSTPLRFPAPSVALRVLPLALLLAAASCQPNRKGVTPVPSAERVQATRKLFRDSLPQPVGYVNDFEGIFTDREERLLDSLIGAFERRTTIQMAVITLDTTMTSADSLDALILRFANTWGVGRKETNNGVTIGMSAGHRRMRISNGFGIEKILSDEETKAIMDSSFLPYFRKNAYFEGTWQGLLALMKVLEARYR
jgi:uncharacterized protein